MYARRPTRAAGPRPFQIKGDGQREALGVQVPPRGAAQRQERVQVGVRAGGDVVGWGTAEREVEQHQLQFAAAVFGNADVLGLDVAVGDPFRFEVVDGFDQLFAKALEHVEREASVFLEFFSQRFGTGTLEQQGCASGNNQRLAVGDDVLVVQAGEHLTLSDQALVVRDAASHLEDGLFVAAITPHERRVAGGATAHALDDGEAAFEPVARAGDAGVDGGFGIGRGEFVFAWSRSSRKPWMVS